MPSFMGDVGGVQIQLQKTRYYIWKTRMEDDET